MEDEQEKSTLRTHIPEYDDLLTYFANIANCLEGSDAPVSNSEVLESVSNEILRALRASFALFTDDELSKRVEKVVYHLQSAHVQKIWVLLNGSFFSLSEGSASSYVLQALIARCEDIQCLCSMGNELIMEDSTKVRLVWSKSGSHVIKSLLEQVEKEYLKITDFAVKEETSDTVLSWCKVICTSLQAKQFRAMSNQSPLTVLLTLSKIGRAFPGILKNLLEIFFKDSKVTPYEFFQHVISSNLSSRFIESLLAADYEVTMKNVFHCEDMISSEAYLGNFFEKMPLEKPLMHILSKMVHLAPMQGDFSLPFIWKIIISKYGEMMINKCLYGVFFSLLDRKIDAMGDQHCDIHSNDDMMFFYNAQKDIHEILHAYWTKTKEDRSGSDTKLTLCSISHSLLEDGSVFNIGLHLITLLIRAESMEILAFSDTHTAPKGLSPKKAYFYGEEESTEVDQEPRSVIVLRDFLSVPSEVMRNAVMLPEGSRLLQFVLPIILKQDKSSKIEIKSDEQDDAPNTSKKRKVASPAQTKYPRFTRFLRRFNKHFATIGCNAYGSHFIECLLNLIKELPEFQWVGDQLRATKSLQTLRSTCAGRVLMTKFELEARVP